MQTGRCGSITEEVNFGKRIPSPLHGTLHTRYSGMIPRCKHLSQKEQCAYDIMCATQRVLMRALLATCQPAPSCGVR
jgi:hypothetical protein